MARRLGAGALGARLVVALLVTAGLGLGLAAPASAAGDPALDRLVVTDPVPGWALLPSPALQNVVSFEDRTISDLSGQTATAAAEGWQGADAEQRLIVVLIRFPGGIPFVVRNLREAVIAACTSSTGNAPTTPVRSYTPIPGAEEAECSGTNVAGNAISGTSMSWVRGNVVALLEGVGLPQGQVQSVALRQSTALPATGVRETSSHSGIVIGVAAAVLAVVVVGLVALMARTRRRAHAAATVTVPWAPGTVDPPTSFAPTAFPPTSFPPTPVQPVVAAGWMPDPSGRHAQRYWSGTAWTEHVFTDGRAGVDPLSGPPRRRSGLGNGRR